MTLVDVDAGTPVVFGGKWLDRRLHRVAVRLTESQFKSLAEGPLVRRGASPARLATMAVSVVLLAAVLALAALGVWLVLYDFFSVSTVLGLVLLAVAFVLRPRLPGLPGDVIVLDPARTPALVALVERVATAVGAPAPSILLLGYGFNAYTTIVGLKRERALCLGLPLWATLEPQERVALLGHEMGHFVNGDVRRGLLTQMARTTLAKVAALFSTRNECDDLIAMVTSVIINVINAVVSRTSMALQLLIEWTSLRDRQRAEYLADEFGARAGGSAAAATLADSMLLHEPIDTVVRREARAGNGPDAWLAAARVARANQAPDLPARRLLSRRAEASLFASHPPAGMRAAMVEQRPQLPAAVVLTEAESARIDAELAPHVKRVRLALTQ
ncbi:M48 family metalloprotease [Paractinoplanes atraurantiacus]|uniref:Zn-dependent protease with chaperone function n=1 Tax=Paractinoplanes atraurantiacus TaxID=1036182 RepID=A0A285I1V2_9ACTN|nr:M48 family metallopeptidase [Actinoplanes atraurantiacus]SNY41056.1 Zn-dependent protease with chaperone function [Actinoplanes atraurantiacus]